MNNLSRKERQWTVGELIKSRRAVFPQFFTQRQVDREDIEFMLEMANLAPTHKLTEPWRFKVIQGKALDRLGVFMAQHYRSSVEAEHFSQWKYDKPIDKCSKASAVILICIQRDPLESIPEWEELAAVSCAVENLWLTASALGLGGYWSSASVIDIMGRFTKLNDGERCLGNF